MEAMFLPALVNRCDVCFLQLVLGICVFFSLVGPSFIFHGCVFSLLVWPNSERVLLCFDFQRRCCGFPRDMHRVFSEEVPKRANRGRKV